MATRVKQASGAAMGRTRTRGWALALVASQLACAPRGSPPLPDAGADGGSVSAPERRPQGPTASLPRMEPSADPVRELQPFVRGRSSRSAYCVQIRSFPAAAEAQALQRAIEEKLALPTHVLEAEVADRGTWHRVCVGAFADEAAAETAGQRWTAENGVLRPFMAAIEAGHAAFLVKPRPDIAQLLPTKAQADTLRRARPGPDRPVFLTREAVGLPVAAVTWQADPQREDVIFVAADGSLIPLTHIPTTACSVCAEALRSPGDFQRRVLFAADVGPWPGDEFLITETVSTVAEGSTTVLSLVSRTDDGMQRRATLLLRRETASYWTLGSVEAVAIDESGSQELAVVRRELPISENRACALRTYVDLYEFQPDGVRQLDATFVAAMYAAGKSGGRRVVKNLIRTHDRLGDPLGASRTCAAYLAQGPDAEITEVCVSRLQALGQAGRWLDATNAAGLLSEASGALRGLIAAPFYQAVSALERDGRRVIATTDCQADPLVTAVSEKRADHVVDLARAKLAERLNMAELVDAVFVTAVRDYGKDTPLGQVVYGWLSELRDKLPARHALIEAALLPAPDAIMTPEKVRADENQASPNDAGSAKGSYIRIQVEDGPILAPTDALGGPP